MASKRSPSSAYFVLLYSLPGSGLAEAMAVGPMSEAQFAAKYGITPAQSGVPHETNAGYPTLAAAQKAADAFNRLPPKKRHAGTSPPNEPPMVPQIHSPWSALTQFLSLLENKNLWLRVGEVGLGLVLIAVGIAKMTNAVPVATKVAKAAGASALL